MNKKNRLMEKTASPLSVDETILRLERNIRERGGSVFALFDHAKNAEEVGLKLRSNKVIVFGSPKVGTLLMRQNPEISIELPLRISVWEDAEGKVWVGYPNMEMIAMEYGMEDSEIIQKLRESVVNIVKQAVER